MKIKQLQKSWEEKKIGEVFITNPQKQEIKDLSDDLEISFVPMKFVSAKLKKITDKETKKLSQVRKGYTYFKNEDIILAKITPCFENGKIAIAQDLTNGIGFGSTEFHVFRFEKEVLIKFLYYFLQQDYFRSEAKRKMTGTAGQLRVPIKFVEEFLISFPPLPFQKQIVQAIETQFSRLDKTIENLKSVEKKLGVYRKAVLKKAFEKGEEVELGKIFEIVMGQSPPSEFYNKERKGLPFFQGKKEFEAKYPRIENWTEKHNKEADKGDLLVSIRAPIGPCNIAPEKCAIGRGIAVIKVSNKIESLFAFYLIKYNEQKLDSKGTGTTFKAISKTSLNSFVTNIPNKKEWGQIVSQIESKFSVIEKVEQTVSQSLIKAEQLRKSILKMAFEGRLA